jgi:hypothetical protein
VGYGCFLPRNDSNGDASFDQGNDGKRKHPRVSRKHSVESR